MTEELIKGLQVRQRHLHAQGLLAVVTDVLFGLGRQVLAHSQLADSLTDDLGIEAIGTAAVLEDLLHAL